MLRKITYLLVLSSFAFNVLSSDLSLEDRDQKIVLEKKVKELVKLLPVEAIEEIESLKDLDVEESAPIVSEIIGHYTEEIGANYNGHADDFIWWWIFFNYAEYPETAVISTIILFSLLFL